jgi:hypothetical protein
MDLNPREKKQKIPPESLLFISLPLSTCTQHHTSTHTDHGQLPIKINILMEVMLRMKNLMKGQKFPEGS